MGKRNACRDAAVSEFLVEDKLKRPFHIVLH